MITALMIPLSCAHYSDSSPGFEARITDVSGADRFQKLETELTMTAEKAAGRPDYQLVENIAVPYMPTYRMGPGDVLEIVYHSKYEVSAEDYRLEIQDRISIHFPFQPQFSTSAVIRPDGKITVPIIGDVSVESKTPAEAAAILNREYKKYITEPSITVAIEAFSVRTEELKKAITATRGQGSKGTPISPDGRIAFPLIGGMPAQGLTVAQLEKMINERYAKQARNLSATLILQEIRHPKVYILGEVEKPGAYDIGSVTNVLHALALSGGFKKSAGLEEIAIFRNEGLERPLAFKVDVRRALKAGVALTNIRLKPGDILYVPKTRLDEVTDAIEKIFTKGIYAVLPFTVSLGTTYYIEKGPLIP
ncbi:MAG: polysaccharide biosynthesis/export family protein [Thermodesulfobacteriota bacterium]